MKFLSLLFMFALIISCHPISLDDEGGRARDRDRGPNWLKDRTSGEREFPLPDIKDLTVGEIKDATFLGDCADYKSGVNFSLFPNLLKPFQNCAAKALDNGLAPLCEQQEEAEELLEYYEKEGDHAAVEETEAHINRLEDIKYDFADDLYDMAEEAEEVKDDLMEDIEDNPNDDLGEKLKNLALKGLAKAATDGFINTLDDRAERACAGRIDLDKIKKRRSRRR